MKDQLNKSWDRFFKGETSLKEEIHLKNTEKEEAYIHYLKEKENTSFDFSFEELLEKERILEDENKPLSIKKYEFGLKQLIAVAAILLLFGVYFTYDSGIDEKILVVKNGEQIKNEKIAKQETKKALILLVEKLDETQKGIAIINKQLKK